MSNLLLMDDSNGNGIYSSKSSATTITTTPATPIPTTAPVATTIATNNINNIINAATAAAATTTTTLPTSVSSEDLSQSLSEYTDADESISAPTEFLAEFLSAVMLKDYKRALKYCKLILQYEPNNTTANEFYPLIQDKLKESTLAVVNNSDSSDENYNKSSSPELALELQASTEPSTGESDEASDDQQVARCGKRFAGGRTMGTDHSSGENISNSSSYGSDRLDQNNSNSAEENDEDEGEGNDGEESDCDDDENDVEVEDDADVDDEDCDVDEEDDDDDVDGVDEVEPDSSSGDDLPIDDDDDNPLPRGVDGGGGGEGRRMAGHAFNSPRNSSSGGEGRSRSDNTTHSYSSLLLEEEEGDDIVAGNLKFCKELSSPDLDVSNGNKITPASCSDSESPTEPLTQRLAAILRSRCVINGQGENY